MDFMKMANKVLGNQANSSGNLLESLSIAGDEMFFPNMCHVCRCFGEKVKLKWCGACKVISYCSVEHQKRDWPKHKEFCNILCQMKKELEVNNIFESFKEPAEEFPLRKWENVNDKIMYFEQILAQLKKIAVKLLKRQLTIIEDQMLSFPRVCAVCYECKPELLTNCKKCPQSCFCKDHLDDPSHESECIRLISNFYTCSGNLYQSPLLLPELRINSLKTTYQPKIKKFPSSMSEFIDTYLRIDLGRTEKLTDKVKYMNYASISDRFSRPLTLLFTIKNLGLNLKSMVIHLVGASMEEQFINDWEMILHYLPELRELKLIMIGLELLSETSEMKNICNQCKKEKRVLKIETRKQIYDKYCSDKNFLKPDIIACFSAGFHVYPTWEPSIKVFNKGQCPLLVTAIAKTEGLIGKDIVDKIFPSAKCAYSDFNPFAVQCYFKMNVFNPVSSTNQFMFFYEYLDKNGH